QSLLAGVPGGHVWSLCAVSIFSIVAAENAVLWAGFAARADAASRFQSLHPGQLQHSFLCVSQRACFLRVFGRVGVASHFATAPPVWLGDGILRNMRCRCYHIWPLPLRGGCRGGARRKCSRASSFENRLKISLNVFGRNFVT